MSPVPTFTEIMAALLRRHGPVHLYFEAEKLLRLQHGSARLRAIWKKMAGRDGDLDFLDGTIMA
jgi:hypothetical protein